MTLSTNQLVLREDGPQIQLAAMDTGNRENQSLLPMVRSRGRNWSMVNNCGSCWIILAILTISTGGYLLASRCTKKSEGMGNHEVSTACSNTYPVIVGLGFLVLICALCAFCFGRRE